MSSQREFGGYTSRYAPLTRDSRAARLDAWRQVAKLGARTREGDSWGGGMWAVRWRMILYEASGPYEYEVRSSKRNPKAKTAENE